MYRRPATIDPELTHLWTGDDTTACGYTGESIPAYGSAMCLACLRRYGAELAAAFGHLPWLASPQGITRHAFDLNAPPADSGRVWPVCHIRTYAPDGLRPTDHRMRCPHCLAALQHRKEGPQ